VKGRRCRRPSRTAAAPRQGLAVRCGRCGP
jgi:hypothetical protein